MVHGIVKEYGGDIDVHSEIGKGTTFQVYFPIVEIETETKHTPAAANKKQPTGTEHILFVDDEIPIAQMGKMMLEKLGYKVTSETNSLNALNVFKKAPFSYDLVISDRSMPTMTGIQLSAELISIRPDIPIIICTGFTEEKDEQIAIEIGVKGFLSKPAAMTDLAMMVRKVLDEASAA